MSFLRLCVRCFLANLYKVYVLLGSVLLFLSRFFFCGVSVIDSGECVSVRELNMPCLSFPAVCSFEASLQRPRFRFLVIRVSSLSFILEYAISLCGLLLITSDSLFTSVVRLVIYFVL